MDKMDFLNIINNAKTKSSILDALGYHRNGSGLKKLVYLCESYDLDFEFEFGLKVNKKNNCGFCGEDIRLNRKFCNSSCSAKSSNHNRKQSKETRIKISNKIKENYKKGYKNPNEGKSVIVSKNYNKETGRYRYDCKLCGSEYFTFKCPSFSRKTCSRECATKSIFLNRTYQNGSRKTFYHFNESSGKTVTLDSSWELVVAKLLDSKNIKWVRPKSLKWFDKNNISRQYYPDFYLVDYDLYLDPKNPYCMSLDKYKMKCIEKVVNIKYGDVKHIVAEINKLK